MSDQTTIPIPMIVYRQRLNWLNASLAGSPRDFVTLHLRGPQRMRPVTITAGAMETRRDLV